MPFPPEAYLWFKTLHIVGVVVWFAGLFYLVRLFIYHVETAELAPELQQPFRDQYSLMEKRLATSSRRLEWWWRCQWPSACWSPNPAGCIRVGCTPVGLCGRPFGISRRLLSLDGTTPGRDLSVERQTAAGTE